MYNDISIYGPLTTLRERERKKERGERGEREKGGKERWRDRFL